MSGDYTHNARIEMMGNLLGTAEQIALRYFRTPRLAVDNKERDGFDPVTVADREIEQAMSSAIGSAFPADAIIGEESDNKTGQSGYEWVIDPIDGTRAFIIGAPSFTILLALRYNGQTIASVISQPFTGERFRSAAGVANYERGDTHTTLRTSGNIDLSSAILATTFPEIGTAVERQRFEELAANVKMTRYGLDGYAYALLASGHIDLVVEAGLKPFDYRAPEALIRAAGGVVTDWSGNEPNGVSTIIAAATPELAEQAYRYLR